MQNKLQELSPDTIADSFLYRTYALHSLVNWMSFYIQSFPAANRAACALCHVMALSASFSMLL